VRKEGKWAFKGEGKGTSSELANRVKKTHQNRQALSSSENKTMPDLKARAGKNSPIGLRSCGEKEEGRERKSPCRVSGHMVCRRRA